MKYESEVRDSMLAELIEDVECGATPADMLKKLKQYQQSGKDLR